MHIDKDQKELMMQTQLWTTLRCHMASEKEVLTASRRANTPFR
jgi:hypothetical protein